MPSQHHKATKLPLIHAGHEKTKPHLPGSVASHSNLLRHSASHVLITPSMLEESGHLDEHGNVVSAVCVGLGASGFDLNDSDFGRLESVDFGDNKLVFADAAVFPSLRMLNLYCNGISSLQHPASSFRFLEVLNLSFNLINTDAIMPLFAIKSLVVLDLSFNMISRIPNRWHSLPHLKILSLEKNGLHHEESFAYLSLAPSLQELNLSSNKLSCVPASCSAPGRFPELLFISLVDNLFAHEKDVVALSAIPSIQQVDLWNNPMSSNSGPKARSRRSNKSSRSPSPKVQASLHQELPAAAHEGFLRVLTPANFQRRVFQSGSSPSPGSVVPFVMRPKRALADIEQEAREVFRDGYVFYVVSFLCMFTTNFRMASLNDPQQSFGTTTLNLRKLKSILNSSLVGSHESVIMANETVCFTSNFIIFQVLCMKPFQTLMNPTLGLIERMKVVGADIERRKSNVPDRFFSHFYFGPVKNLHSVSGGACCAAFERVTSNAGKTFGTGT